MNSVDVFATVKIHRKFHRSCVKWYKVIFQMSFVLTTSLTTGETTTGFCKSRGNSAGVASIGTDTGVCTTGTGSGACTTGTGSGACTTGTGSGAWTLGRLVRTGRSSTLYSRASLALTYRLHPEKKYLLSKLSNWDIEFKSLYIKFTYKNKIHLMTSETSNWDKDFF